MKVIYNFFWFLWRLFKNRNNDDIIISKEKQLLRFEICNNCPLINKKGLLVKIKGPRCSICGCWLPWKVRYAFEQCPDIPPRWNKE